MKIFLVACFVSTTAVDVGNSLRSACYFKTLSKTWSNLRRCLVINVLLNDINVLLQEVNEVRREC